MHIATISSKRQITLPQAFLNALGINTGEKVIVEKKARTLRLKPMGKSIIEEVGGSLYHIVPREKRGKPFEEILATTKRLAAKKLVRE